MPKNPSFSQELEDIPIDFVRHRFDGIQFLWRTLETRYILKLMIALFGSMIIYLGIICISIILFGDILLIGSLSLCDFFGFLSFLAEPIFMGLFLFILIQLARLYWNDSKYRLFPEKNPCLKMKYWPSTKSSGYNSLVLPVIILLSFILYILSLLAELILYGKLIWIFGNTGLFSLFITAFIAAKGSMKSFEERYKEKFQRQRYLYFILLPIPWIILFFLSFVGFDLTDYTDILGRNILLWVSIGYVLYGFLGVLGLIVLIKRSWWAGYTASQVSASLTFLFVIIIPFLMGVIIGLFGHIVSLIAMGYFFIQGTLDKHGDNLRGYYSAWDKKLQQFNINSEEDIHNQAYDKAFDKTPLDTDVQNAYHDLIIGLALLLVSFFGILIAILPNFPILGTESGMKSIESFLSLASAYEALGLTLALFIFTIVIGFSKPKKQ